MKFQNRQDATFIPNKPGVGIIGLDGSRPTMEWSRAIYKGAEHTYARNTTTPPRANAKAGKDERVEGWQALKREDWNEKDQGQLVQPRKGQLVREPKMEKKAGAKWKGKRGKHVTVMFQRYKKG